ncbi:Short-chain dehydrogenase/reductase SDR [Candidatus Burkholderia humilis]|nr:Short-chain dehydrogenase/reductase SDR [Candidatus Burkholderia humilis]
MKTVLIVGASRDIGHEFAREYCRDGWRMLATARDKTSLSSLDALGAQTFSLDVTQPEQIASLAWQLDEERLDVAIIVSGVYGPRTEGVETIGAEDFDQVMHTNVRGPMQLTPVLLPLTDAAQGVLAVVSSKMGSIGEASGTTGWLYRTSKAALNCALKVASLESQHTACISLTRDEIYAAFYDDSVTRGFLHSHSYTAIRSRAARRWRRSTCSKTRT